MEYEEMKKRRKSKTLGNGRNLRECNKRRTITCEREPF